MNRSKASSTDASISALGQKLLEGWVMLGDYCSNCKVPLVQHRQSGERLCVSCGGHGEDDAAPTPVQNASSGQLTPNGADAYDPRADDRLGPYAMAALSPNNHAGGGLAGGSGSAAPRPSAATQDDFNQDVPGLVFPPALQRPDAGSIPVPSRDGKRKDVSQLIADKLLAGWALLDSYCPVCTTPIVRSKQKKMYCVQCELYLLTEEEARREQAAAAAPPPMATVTPLAPGRPPTSDPLQLGHPSAAAPEPLALTRGPAAPRRDLSAPSTTAAVLQGAQRDAVQSTLDAVLQKIGDYGQRLQGSAASQIAYDVVLLEALGKAADVAEKLQRLAGTGTSGPN